MSAAGRGSGGRSSGGRGRRGGSAPVRRFPRAARINEVLRQVLAEELERLVDTDDRLTLLTITAVETDRDLRSATLLFSRLGPVETEALADARIRLQATVARQVKLKWTPLLSFAEDPAIVGGQRVEEILARIRTTAPQTPTVDPKIPGPEPARSEVASREVADREVAAPEAADPEAPRSEVAAPEVADPEAVRSEAPDPEAADPEAADPEAADPEAADPEAVRSEVAAPEVADPEAVRSEAPDSEPGAEDAARPRHDPDQ